MTEKIKILAICGSTRKSSSNLNLIKAIADLTSGTFTIDVFEDLTQIPHFNPDLDTENAPEQVTKFRRQLSDAAGVIISTPEYAIGVPGTLKNAVDWTISSMDFSQKPVALITASLSGQKAHASLLGTLLIIEARITADTQMVIPFIKTKVNENGKITDNETFINIDKLIKSLTAIINNDLKNLLPAPILMNEEK